MDVKLKLQSARLCFLTLLFLLNHSLGGASVATAEEAIASDAELTSTIFISDENGVEPPNAPQATPPKSAEGSIVFIEDAPIVSLATAPGVVQPATFTRPSATGTPQPVVTRPVARGDLRVVSNEQSQIALKVAEMLPSQAPIVQLPATTQATIRQVDSPEPIAVSAVRDQPGDVQNAVHAEPVAQQSEKPKTEAVALAELLIAAHKLSLQAKTDAEYSRITRACAEAISLGAHHDQREFAMHLSSWALNRRGQLCADQGDQELANADFQAALDFNPKNWRALHNRGVTFAQAGEFAEAFDDFNAVIQVNSNYAKAYANRATLYVQAKDLQSAIKDYEQAIQIDREFATAHVGLGRVCHMLGRWEEAVDHFTSAVQLEPTSADMICSRGDLQADMGHYGEALADYARTIELAPEFAHAYRNGAWLLATCPDEQYRDPINAVRGARQALEYSYGDRHVALDTLAAALASNGEFEEAIQTVTQAVEMAPEDAKFTYLLRMQLYQDQLPFRTEPVGLTKRVSQ